MEKCLNAKIKEMHKMQQMQQSEFHKIQMQQMMELQKVQIALQNLLSIYNSVMTSSKVVLLGTAHLILTVKLVLKNQHIFEDKSGHFGGIQGVSNNDDFDLWTSLGSSNEFQSWNTIPNSVTKNYTLL